jgi:HSP20 family protein
VTLMHVEPLRAMRDLDRFTSQLLSGTRVPLPMPMDVWREGDQYHVAMDLPGVEPDSIELNVERNTLTVTARREGRFGSGTGSGAGSGSEDGGIQVLVAERPQGRFSRQLLLGDSLDVDSVRADYADGVLHVTIPVKQAAKPRRIEIGRPEDGGRSRVIQGERQETPSTSQQTASASGGA